MDTAASWSFSSLHLFRALAESRASRLIGTAFSVVSLPHSRRSRMSSDFVATVRIHSTVAEWCGRGERAATGDARANDAERGAARDGLVAPR